MPNDGQRQFLKQFVDRSGIARAGQQHGTQPAAVPFQFARPVDRPGVINRVCHQNNSCRRGADPAVILRHASFSGESTRSRIRLTPGQVDLWRHGASRPVASEETPCTTGRLAPLRYFRRHNSGPLGTRRVEESSIRNANQKSARQPAYHAFHFEYGESRQDAG